MNGVEIATQAGNIRGRLKQAMSERGIDGAPALAGVCGLAESTARSYINGTRSPPLDVCMKIGLALGVSGAWLFHGTGSHESRAAGPGHTVEARLAVAQAELRRSASLPSSCHDHIIVVCNDVMGRHRNGARAPVCTHPHARASLSNMISGSLCQPC